jgi:small subunit ribosomal protein S18
MNVDNNKRRFYVKRRYCRFCADSKIEISYKNIDILKQFISIRGKILPRRISGNCARHQREVSVAIKRARYLALLPYTTVGHK